MSNEEMRRSAHLYTVGQPYSITRSTWPEGSDLNLRNGNWELRLFYSSPTDREVEDVRRGESRFGLVFSAPVILLLYRFGEQPWSDSSFSPHLLPQEQTQAWPERLEGEDRTALQVLLIDADTGILRALRVVTFSPRFSEVLAESVTEQLAETWDSSAYDQKLDELYREDPRSLLGRSLIQCRGGN